MSRRGRKPLAIPTVEWKCRIPSDIAAKIDMIQMDPIYGVPKYGERSALVTQLLRLWLAQYEKGNPVDTLAQTPDNSVSSTEGVTP